MTRTKTRKASDAAKAAAEVVDKESKKKKRDIVTFSIFLFVVGATIFLLSVRYFF
jgi:hypothetical protein